jgi:hypothetical protein
MSCAQTRKRLLKQSRAALWTIQLAVDAVADSIHQLKLLQGHAHRGHRAALVTLRLARHHALKDCDLQRVEDTVGKFARLTDWPAAMRARSRYEHLERPSATRKAARLPIWRAGRFWSQLECSTSPNNSMLGMAGLP